MNNEYYRNIEEVESCLAAILTQTTKLKELKRNITIYVKGLGWPEYYNPWSIRVNSRQRQHSPEYLKNYLIHTINNSILKNKKAILPIINVLSKQDLLSLEAAIIYIRESEEKNVILINKMGKKCSEENPLD